MTIKANTIAAAYDSAELKEIFDLTLRLCQIDPKSKRRSKIASAYWENLVRLWKNHISIIGYNVVYAALHCIYWGIFPPDIPNNADLSRLVELVKLELLKINEDTEPLKERQFFGSSLTAVLNSKSPYAKSGNGWKSNSYRQFLNYRIKYKLHGGEYVLAQLNLLDTPHSTFEKLKENAHTRKRYETLKARIIRVLPEAQSWDEKLFLNDMYLLDRLKKAHGISYLRKWRDFDCLLNSINRIDRGATEQYTILEMEKVPDELAKIIWPTNTEACIEQLFNDVFTTPVEYLYLLNTSYKRHKQNTSITTRMKDSWLYHQIEQWNIDKTYVISDETRRLLFNLSLGM